MVAVPAHPKIYHILHFDRLPSIIRDGHLLSDAEVSRRGKVLSSCPRLRVSDFVPFYFCPRSVMLYVIFRATDPGLPYRGGQGPIIHLEADFRESVKWANTHVRYWAFTSSNAASDEFKDYSDLADLNKIDWNAVYADPWWDVKKAKQAEFLVEREFPWELISRIGVRSCWIRNRVLQALEDTNHQPPVEVLTNWYY